MENLLGNYLSGGARTGQPLLDTTSTGVPSCSVLGSVGREQSQYAVMRLKRLRLHGFTQRQRVVLIGSGPSNSLLTLFHSFSA